jgi:hypothetical protein
MIAPLHAQLPRWASLDSIALGAPVDDIVARGGTCLPAFRAELEGARSLGFYPSFLFGASLPHTSHDTAAVRTALQGATVCGLALLNGRAWMNAVAFDRTIDVIHIWFGGRHVVPPFPLDSAVSYLQQQWGRGSGDNQLRTWESRRFRSYFLQQHVSRDSVIGWRAVMLDLRACTAFERALHQARGSGPHTTCS